MIGELPTSLTVGGVERKIKTDFQVALDILVAFENPDLKDEEKILHCMTNLYEDFYSISVDDFEEAYTQAVWFLDCGQSQDKKGDNGKVLDWEQDAPLIFPAVNAVAGKEIRAPEHHIHWWTFMGYFMEVSKESTIAQVLSIRTKRKKGKKLEDWEREFWQANKEICILQPKLTKEEKEEKERINAMLN